MQINLIDLNTFELKEYADEIGKLKGDIDELLNRVQCAIGFDKNYIEMHRNMIYRSFVEIIDTINKAIEARERRNV